MTGPRYPRIASFRTVGALEDRLRLLGLELPVDPVVDPAPESALARPFRWRGRDVGNRWCILPMEGWDGTADGRPTDLTTRRWTRFGESGAKLIWGGEAVAVVPEGRANPNQLLASPATRGDLARLRDELVAAHRRRFGRDDDLVVGLQLTHSGRFCRPERKDRPEPRIVYRHPILDRRMGIPPDHPLLEDGEIRRIADAFVSAARLARSAGFHFVDVKHCHGYLGHELLSAVDRPGPYGGSLENRTRFLREIVGGIRSAAPGLEIAVRLSAFDTVPFRAGAAGTGEPEPAAGAYRLGFGCDPERPTQPRLEETEAFLGALVDLGIDLVCLSAGSPYYNPHIQRPALFPPSDGYDPPEDPLVGVARQMAVTAALKHRFPSLAIVGSAYTYLQEYVAHVAQAAVDRGWTDFAGLGRMVLSYHDLPADQLAGRPPDATRLCRTFSDCTTGPRNGLVSGCYPLDPGYRRLPEAAALRALKARRRN
jgi:2,4-dienoyl-CoA reductase-like NADH-dependent reductase (Old Yellow Enzyme family)